MPKELNHAEQWARGLLLSLSTTVKAELSLLNFELQAGDIEEALKRVRFIGRQCEHVLKCASEPPPPPPPLALRIGDGF